MWQWVEKDKMTRRDTLNLLEVVIMKLFLRVL